MNSPENAAPVNAAPGNHANDKAAATNTNINDPLVIAGKTFHSRLFVGTGKYKDGAQTKAALEASGAEVVTQVNIFCCPTPPVATRRKTPSARRGWGAKWG